MIVRDNYKLVQAYLDYRRRVIQNDSKTVRSAESCLRHLLEWADDVPFQKAAGIRKTFSEYMLTARNDGKKNQLSPSRMEKTLAFARDLFYWARREHPGRFRSVGEAWIETLQVRRSAKAQSKLIRREYYTLEEVLRIIEAPTPDDQTLRFKRDKVALAFLFLSGMRDGAFVTLPVGAVDIAHRQISQFPELGVQTKNSKAAVTTLLPIPRLLDLVVEWDAYIRTLSTDPRLAWYTRLSWEGLSLDTEDLIAPNRKFTGRVSALRAGLAALCQNAGMAYKSPHKARHGHGVYGIKRAKTIAELKALSQNMMHETVTTTDGIYGRLADDDVARIISTFSPD